MRSCRQSAAAHSSGCRARARDHADTSDEKAHQGALLHTQFGRGDFVYCSLAIYRQLRNGNPGAVRLLINLLAR